MRLVKQFRQMRAQLLGPGNYDITYTYDIKNRIHEEIVTGDITRTTTFAYDEETDNIVTETIAENGKTTVKSYQYDGPDGSISKVLVREQA